MNLNSTLGAAYSLKGALPQGMKEPKPPKAPTMPKKPGMPEFPEGDSGHPDSSALQSGPDNEPTPAVGSARWVNIAAIGVVIGAIAVAITQQYGYGMAPSALGVVERSALIGAAIAPMLNLLRGMRPNHYAIAILAAVVGCAASGRQILDHATGDLTLDPNEVVFGRPMFEWAFAIFLVAVVACAAMLLWTSSWRAVDRGLFHHRGAARAFAFSTIVWLSAYVILSLVQVIANCGVTMCPADPSSTGAQSFEFTFSVSGSDGVEASISIPGFVTVMLGIGLISFIVGAIVNARIDGGARHTPKQPAAQDVG